MKKLNLFTILLVAITMLFLMSSFVFGGEALYVAPYGKIGIGIESPQQLLHIHNPGTGAYDYAWTSYTTGSTGSTSTDGFGVGVGYYNWGYIWNRENAGLIFGTNGTERMRIISNGNIGIHTTTPEAVFNVRGGTDVEPDSGHPGMIVVGGLSGNNIGIDDNEIMARTNYAYGNLYLQKGGGGLYLLNTWYDSDLRLKENVNTLQNALEKINRLRGVSFEWADKAKDEREHMGLIAQEVEEVFPELVGVDEDGNKVVAYIDLIAPLIESVKELKAENDSLMELISQLEERIVKLEGNE